MTTTTNDGNSNIIVTPDFNGGTCGAITYWRLTGNVSHSALTAAWAAQGLDSAWLPDPPAKETCLRRAVLAQGYQRGTERRIIRPLGDKQGAWIVLDERVAAAGDDVVHTHVCRVRFAASRFPCPWWIEAIDGDQYTVGEIANAVEVAYIAARQELSGTDVSLWLISLTSQFNAVGLRERGGIYFVPRPAVDTWTRVAAALRACSTHVIYRIPALASDEAAEAVIDAVAAEAEAEAAKIVEDLTFQGDDALGTRALERRADRARVTLDKVQSYEGLLGVKLDALRARLGDLQTSVSAAILAAQADDDSNATAAA